MILLLDDTIIWDDGYGLVLAETKSVGTLKTFNLPADMMTGHVLSVDPRAQSLQRSRQSRASQVYHVLRQQFYREMMGYIELYQEAEISFSELQDLSRNLLLDTYQNVYMQARRMAVSDRLYGGEHARTITKDELEWVKSAVREEWKFLQNFLDDIRTGNLTIPIEQRLEMYADTLRAIYNAARVVASPADALVYWVTKADRNVCPSCRWLSDHSPYSKYNLPTTPRAGLTLCLSRCRCRLLIRRETADKIAQQLKDAPAKDSMIRALQDIKAGRRKYRPT